MNAKLWTTCLLSALALGCPGDDGSTTSSDGSSGTEGTTASPTTTSPSTTSPTTTSPSTSGVDSSTSAGSTTEGDSTSTGEPGAQFPTFDPLDPMAYAPVDRAGFPAVNTALNLLGDKDVYNAAAPADDVTLAFVSDILTSIEVYHLGLPGSQTPDNTGLDDDLQAFAIQPCTTPPLPMNDCDDQTLPYVLPDVLRVVVGGATTFPNGRRPEEPVMDVALALMLVDQLGPADILTFLDLDGDGTLGPSVDPLANDVAFPGDFPYLAPAHEQ